MEEFTTPPSDPLQQVTPASQWRRSMPRRIYIEETLMSSPSPVIDSTRCEPNNKSITRGKDCRKHPDTTASSDQSSTSILNLDDMSLSVFDDKAVQRKPGGSATTQKASTVSAQPRLFPTAAPAVIASNAYTARVSTGSGGVMDEQSPTIELSSGETFASTNAMTMKPSASLVSQKSDKSLDISRSRIPRRASLTKSDLSAGAQSSGQATPTTTTNTTYTLDNSDKSRNSNAGNTYTTETRSNSDTVTLDSKSVEGHDVAHEGTPADDAVTKDATLADYLCPVEMSAVTDMTQDTLNPDSTLKSDLTEDSLTKEDPKHDTPCSDIRSINKSNGNSTTIKSYTLAPSPHEQTRASPSINLMNFSSANNSAVRSTSRNITDANTPVFSVSKAATPASHTATPMATHSVTPTTHTATPMTTHTPALISLAGDGSITTTPKSVSRIPVPSSNATDQLQKSRNLLEFDAHANDDWQALHSSLRQDKLSSSTGDNQTRSTNLSVTTPSRGTDPNQLSPNAPCLSELEGHVNVPLTAANITADRTGYLGGHVPGVSHLSVGEAEALTPHIDADIDPLRTSSRLSEQVPSPVHSVKAVTPMQCHVTATSEPVRATPPARDVPDLERGMEQSIQKLKHLAADSCDTSSGSESLPLDVPSRRGSGRPTPPPGHEDRSDTPRPISPIDHALDLTHHSKDDELDTQSESGWSVYSEISESGRPMYSDSYLKTLMSKDAAAMLKSISQRSSEQGGSSRSSTTSTLKDAVIRANMNLINSPPIDQQVSRRPGSGLSNHSDSESRNVKIAHQEVSKSPTPVGDTATTASQVNKRDTPSINVSTSRMPDSFFDAEQTRLPANSTAISSKLGEGASLSGSSSSTSTVFNDPSGMSISSLQSSPHRSAYNNTSSSVTHGDLTGVVKNAVHSHLFRARSPVDDPTSVSESLTEDLVPVRQEASALQDMLESDHTITPSVSPTLHSTAMVDPAGSEYSINRGARPRQSPVMSRSPVRISPVLSGSPSMTGFRQPLSVPTNRDQPELNTSKPSPSKQNVSPFQPSRPETSAHHTSQPDTSSRLLSKQNPSHHHTHSNMSDTGISLGGADSTISRSTVSIKPPASPKTVSPRSAASHSPVSFRRTHGSPPNYANKSVNVTTGSQTNNTSANITPVASKSQIPILSKSQQGSPDKHETSGGDKTLTQSYVSNNRSNVANMNTPHAVVIHTSPEMTGYTPQNSLYPVTPGHPVCESSHIHSLQNTMQQRALTSPSEKSTIYMSTTEKGHMSQRPDDTTIDSMHQPRRDLTAQNVAGQQDYLPKNTHIKEWLVSQCDEYASHSDPVTIRQSDDTTVAFSMITPNRTANPATTPSASRVHTTQHQDNTMRTAPHNASTNTSPTLSVVHAGNNTTAFQTLHYNEASTMQACETLCQTKLPSPTSPGNTVKPQSHNVIETPSSMFVPGVSCTMTNINVDIPVTNLTNRWLEVTMALSDHRINGKITQSNSLYFRQGDSLLKPSLTDYIPVWLSTAVVGRHEVTVNMSVKSEKDCPPVKMILAIEMESPKVELVDNADGILDFGTLPYGTVKSTPLTLTNKSNVDAQLVIKVIQDPGDRGVMELRTGALSDAPSTQPTKDTMSMRLSLAGYQNTSGEERTQTVYVVNRTPLRHGKAGSPETVKGKIAVYLATAVTGEPLISLSTQCLCGYASVQLPAKYHNFEMRCKPQALVSEQVPVRNGGDIPINVSLSLTNTTHFSVSPEYLYIEPGQLANYRLSFSSSAVTDLRELITCSVVAVIEPEGKQCIIDVRGVVEPPSSIPPHIARLANNSLRPPSSNAGAGSYPGMNLKIKCTPQIIKFGGVELHDRRVVTVKILNYYDEPVRLQLDIDKSDFQILTQMEGKEQLYSAKEIILPVSRSEKDFYHIKVLYEPRQTGFVKSRLKANCSDRDIRFRLPIYGYGGPATIEPAIDSQPSAGVYSLNAGDIHHKQSYLHQFFIRNVGHHKGFLHTEVFSGPACSELLESSRIQVLPSPVVICPADARRVTVNMKISEREKVLCEKSRDVIATIRVTYIDQVLRQLLQRLVAVNPQLSDEKIQPFLSPCSEDRPDLEMAMPDEACSVSLFKHNLKSFKINLYGEPRRHPLCNLVEPSNTQAMLMTQPQTLPKSNSIVMSTKSLTFITSAVGECQELSLDVRNRSTSEVQVQQEQNYRSKRDLLLKTDTLQKMTMPEAKSLIDAINEKYRDTGTVGDNSFISKIYAPPGANGLTEGGDIRIGENLALESYGITAAGDVTELRNQCSKVQELDLIGNKITEWSEVFTLLDGVPLLTFLNLSRNPLTELTIIPDKVYPKVTRLALNFTNVSWKTINNLLKVCPSLEELYLSGNAYEDITLDIPAYPMLRLLQLTRNQLSDWNHIVHLNKVFPGLVNLVLAENPISHCGTKEENAVLFDNLTALNMNSTKIGEWNELDKLSGIRSLQDVRLSGIPLCENIKTSKLREQLLSVHFPHVKRLNGGTVSQGEAETSEIKYLRHFEDETDKPDIYEVLIKKHGPLQQLAEVDMKPKFSVSVNVRCEDRSMVIDVPTKQSVGQLRRSLKQFVGSSKFTMFIDKEHGGYREDVPSCYNNRMVYAMNIQDNDTINCVRTDVPDVHGLGRVTVGFAS